MDSVLIIDALRALFLAALPIGAVAFVLYYWSYKRGYIDPTLDSDAQGEALDKLGEQWEENGERGNPVFQKWMTFGGGFYGMMSFITYIVIEGREIVSFFAEHSTIDALLEQLTFGNLIGLFYQSFLNLIPAFLWWAQWPDFIDMSNGWIWLIVAYLGHEAGVYSASWYFQRRHEV